MNHNRALHIRKKPFNIFAETKWSGPASRSDVATLSKKDAVMKLIPSQSWNRAEIRPMHWNPNENWNDNLTIGDIYYKNKNKNKEKRKDTFLPVNANEYVPSESVVATVSKHKLKKCRICGKLGHIGINCPERNDSSRNARSSSRPSNKTSKTNKSRKNSKDSNGSNGSKSSRSRSRSSRGGGKSRRNKTRKNQS